MKKLLFLLISGFALAQNTDQNFVKTTTYRDQGATKPLHQVTYFDGLGRPIQKVTNAQSNTGKDIVTHIEYDAFGRQVKDYLPYPSSQNNMQFIDPVTASTGTSSYYQGLYGDANPYSEKLLEASPLDKVLKQAAPGNAWAMNSGHEIKSDYQTNTASEIKLFQVTTTWNTSNLLYDIAISNSGNYQANQLYKTVTKDENWISGNNYTTQEFKDKEGRVVLKRTFSNIIEGGTIVESEAKHDTYYIYDQYGNLTYVIPPLADGDISENSLNGLCYQYKYDYRNRLVAKKLPGKQWEFIVYDKLDRPVATGPAFSPSGDATSGVLITEYDVFGRVTQTGWKAMSIDETSRGSWQNNINSGTNPFVLGTTDILTKNFYDNYSFNPNLSVGTPYATNVKGLQTGSWVKVLDPNNPNASELSYTLYDYKYRPIVTHTNNYLGGYTHTINTLDWAGKTLQTQTTHKRVNSDTEIKVTDTFEYTPEDRLSLHKQQINNLPEQLIAKNTYDELGQLTSKNVGGNDVTGTLGLQKVDYNYNIRGWLTAINDVANLSKGTNLELNDLFAFKIGYNTHNTIGTNDIEPWLLYNGNIAETYWRTNSDNVIRKYNYKYDALNRLLDAQYIKPEVSSAYNSYRELLSYDKNGNINYLSRNGDQDSDGSLPENTIDELNYTYDPIKKNQLIKVIDYSFNPQGFRDDSDGVNDPDDDYEYDANGNLTKDDNKGITKIFYNHLNLPTKIDFTSVSNQKIEYIYNALGQKVQKKVYDLIYNGTTFVPGSNVTQYLNGGFQYRDNVLQFFPHAEGYVNNTVVNGANNYNYVFNYTDHLGNIRVSYGIDPDTQVLKIIEENHYYPFGLKHTNYNNTKLIFKEEEERSGVVALKGGGGTPQAPKPTYNYKYNGKELQDELGLNMYDYGARNYDPAIGRWMNIDPLAETSRRWNPYTYCYDNPMRFVDPDGMQADDWRINYVDKNGKQQEFIFNGGQTALPDNQFVRDFVDAYRYNVGNGGGDGLRSVAENPNLMVDVQQTDGVSFTDQPSLAPNSGDYNVVNWNPNMGLETTSGNILSPATVLDHEGDHAGKYAAEGKVKMNLRLEKEDAKYDNKEEKRVVTGSEQRTARANGEIAGPEVTRNNHQGLPVITSSPTSTKVNASKTVQFNQKMADQGIFYNPSFEKYKKR
ncbi:DUF6443 domain-containing protein [Flavobacterium terrae]|uniref:RHS repeat-associated core domain-containing protein n=1 Tax=Flavobacterium terrae TaxID=415425 RepID=A0A1M6CV33_9FLAO|nr:DUF6443 domain-containing protein [Flavobacterium terrae]SHI64887.1 RHS repeat-associated core domain-containing protein [Flavobacterium terrae]